MTKEEVGVIISSSKPNENDAKASDDLILTIVLHHPHERYAPSDTIVVRNVSNDN